MTSQPLYVGGLPAGQRPTINMGRQFNHLFSRTQPETLPEAWRHHVVPHTIIYLAGSKVEQAT